MASHLLFFYGYVNLVYLLVVDYSRITEIVITIIIDFFWVFNTIFSIFWEDSSLGDTDLTHWYFYPSAENTPGYNKNTWIVFPIVTTPFFEVVLARLGYVVNLPCYNQTSNNNVFTIVNMIRVFSLDLLWEWTPLMGEV